MKAILLFFLLTAVLVSTPSLASNTDSIQDQLNGTWSGSWIPEGGVRGSITVELQYDESGRLTGRFVTPVSVNFTKASFNSKSRMLLLEATDAQSGKQYKLNARVEGTEIKGTVAADNQSGEVHLIKWTYVPRITGH
jgi:hypothetical protein